MAKTYNELLTMASIIRTATVEGENTAERVGEFLTECLNYVKENDDTLNSAVTTETDRATAREQTIAANVTGLTASVTEHTSTLEQVLAKNAEQDNEISDLEEDLTAEQTRAVNAEQTIRSNVSGLTTRVNEQDLSIANALAIANGTSSSDVWDMAVKVITFGDGTIGLIPTINQLMLDGYDYKKHGLYYMRYTTTGNNFLLIQGGLNVNNFSEYSARGVTQIVIGNIVPQNNPDTGATGTTWADQGFPNGLYIGPGSMQMLVRRLYFSGNSRVITKWMPLNQYCAEQNDENMSVNSDVAMRPLYFLGNTQFYSGERKVSYNSRTGYYSLNGLTDITADEMRDIYAYSHVPFAAGACLDKRFRTNLPWSVYDVQKGNAQNDSLSVLHLFARNTRLEVVQICSLADYPAKCTNYSYAFLNCSALHTVGEISLTYCTTSSQFYYMFRNCSALANIKISDLKISGFSLAESPLISAASISYLISHASNTSAITVTVHADVLDAISHGEGDWAGIADAATTQQISFVS